jgi:hypothetical protein
MYQNQKTLYNMFFKAVSNLYHQAWVTYCKPPFGNASKVIKEIIKSPTLLLQLGFFLGASDNLLFTAVA